MFVQKPGTAGDKEKGNFYLQVEQITTRERVNEYLVETFRFSRSRSFYHRAVVFKHGIRANNAVLGHPDLAGH